MIRDFNIEWLERRVIIPWSQLTGIGQAIAAGDFFRSQISATSLARAVSSSGVTALATSANNDGVDHLWQPDDLDITKQIRFRIHYTNTATSGTTSWVVAYTPLIGARAGSTTTAGVFTAAAATALNTVIPSESGTTVANTLLVSDFGIINRNTIPDTTDGILLRVTCSNGATAPAGTSLVALEIRYTRRTTIGPRRNILGGKRLVTSRPLGVQWQSQAQEGL